MMTLAQDDPVVSHALCDSSRLEFVVCGLCFVICDWWCVVCGLCFGVCVLGFVFWGLCFGVCMVHIELQAAG